MILEKINKNKKILPLTSNYKLSKNVYLENLFRQFIGSYRINNYDNEDNDFEDEDNNVYYIIIIIINFVLSILC
jgi:hypothetical protein